MKLDLVDVFGSASLKGNPLGVVHGAEQLSDAQMLALTRWLGFSETTFLLPPTEPAADYRVRIFYPAGELPFAGHPTLGTCHAWLESGGKPHAPGMIIQECGAGLIEVRQEEELLAFKAPAFTRTGPLSASELAEACRVAGVRREQVVEAARVENGPRWQMLRLGSVEEVLEAEPAAKAAIGTDVGLVAGYPEGSPLQWELRAFFVDALGRVREDPVTGSFNAGVAMHLFAGGLARASYIAGQGQKLGADGRIYCTHGADGSVWVGGRSATIARGAELPAIPG